MTKKEGIDINELETVMFSGGDSRYIGLLGGGYAALIILFTLLEKGVLTCQGRRFPKFPTPDNEEQEYLENTLRYGRRTHDPEMARDVIQLIWCTQKHLRICKSYKEYHQWLQAGKPFPLYRVMVEPWYPAGRADVGLVFDEKGKEYPQVVIAVEIGDTRIDKPIEAFKGPTDELWVVPYPEWGKPVRQHHQRKYYMFKRGINWNKRWKVNREEALAILDNFRLDENTKMYVKANISQNLPESEAVNKTWTNQ